LADQGAWLVSWGPRPGEPGCQVPPALLPESQTRRETAYALWRSTTWASTDVDESNRNRGAAWTAAANGVGWTSLAGTVRSKGDEQVNGMCRLGFVSRLQEPELPHDFCCSRPCTALPDPTFCATEYSPPHRRKYSLNFFQKLCTQKNEESVVR